MENIHENKETIIKLIEDFHEYHSYKQENYLLDSDGSGFSLYLERDSENNVLLEKTSMALFYSDRVLYRQECERAREFIINSIFCMDLFPRNGRNLIELMTAIRANKITPFVGAGSSVSAGCQTWFSYLSNKAKEVGLAEDQTNSLLSESKYEELLDLIISQPKGHSFDFYFQQDFEYADPDKSFSSYLPEIFKCCVITTNFDRVIEECYARQGLQFKEKCEGLNNPHNFIKAMTRGDHYLLKLHGNIDRPECRVFKHEEYKYAYGASDGQDLNISGPIPALLSHIYLSHSLLFLGCSLSVDRTVKTFQELLKDNALKPKVADHYAIIEQPEEEAEYMNLEMQLQLCNIKPIWYENGNHDKVNEMLLWISNQLKS